MNSTPRDPCEYCDGETEEQIVTARFRYRGKTIYINGVPAWVCTRCGEQYFDAPVYKRLEQLAAQSHLIKKTISFPLAEYDTTLA